MLLPSIAAVPYYWHPPLSGDAGVGYLLILGLLLKFALFVGLILSLVALLRRERYLPLGMLGFLLSATIMYVFYRSG